MRSIVTISSAASVTALTTLERIKAELSIATTAHDAVLGYKIDEASSDIGAHLNRVLARETLSETFWGGIDGIETLMLDRYPVASITSVTVDGVAVDAAEYRLEKESGLLFRLTADGYGSRWSAGKSIVVVFEAGYLLPGQQGRNLPAALEGAAVDLVASYWSSRGRDPLVRSQEIPGVISTTYWVGAVGDAGELPPSVLSKISPFRRPVIA